MKGVRAFERTTAERGARGQKGHFRFTYFLALYRFRRITVTTKNHVSDFPCSSFLESASGLACRSA